MEWIDSLINKFPVNFTSSLVNPDGGENFGHDSYPKPGTEFNSWRTGPELFILANESNHLVIVLIISHVCTFGFNHAHSKGENEWKGCVGVCGNRSSCTSGRFFCNILDRIEINSKFKGQNSK